jgi:hypothetical protein
MTVPDDSTLPLFTYGLFRPGQIGYGRISAFVERTEDGWTAEGVLRERDGLPLLAEGNNDVTGSLVQFKPQSVVAAYTTINSIEPDRLYRWDTADVQRQGHKVRANLHMGRNPDAGSNQAEYQIWEGKKEPLFTAALDVIEKSLERYRDFK